VTYFLTSVIMPDPQTSDMRHIWSKWCQHSLASARINKRLIPFVDYALDGDLCKISLTSVFSFFLIFNHDFIIYTDFTHIAASNMASDDVTN